VSGCRCKAARINQGKRIISRPSDQPPHTCNVTLLAATGLATKEQDNDGDALETISEDQLSELEAIITNVDADKVKFLEYLGVEELSDLPALKYTLAINALNKKGKKK